MDWANLASHLCVDTSIQCSDVSALNRHMSLHTVVSVKLSGYMHIIGGDRERDKRKRGPERSVSDVAGCLDTPEHPHFLLTYRLGLRVCEQFRHMGTI